MAYYGLSACGAEMFYITYLEAVRDFSKYKTVAGCFLRETF